MHLIHVIICITANRSSGAEFRVACRNGRARVAQEIANRMHFNRDEVITGDNAIFETACGGGHLELANWLHATYAVTPRRSGTATVFGLACGVICTHFCAKN